MKRAIITGATGSVGTALIEELVAHGIEVLVLAREGSARNQNIPTHSLVTVRYCALDELANLQNEEGKTYDVFYHFAWEGTTGASRNDMYLQNRNVTYALDALMAAKRFGCQCFVGAGSQAEYGRVEGLLSPDTPARPEMGYGIAKLCAGQMTREMARAEGMRHCWVRILSVFGWNDGMQGLVCPTIHNLRNGVAPKFTKGEQLWDFLYCADAASAFRLVGEGGKDGTTYVLGSGEARPLADYIRDIRDAVTPDAELTFGEIPYADRQVMHLQADVRALRDELGWMPRYTFREGIEDILSRWK